MKRILKICLYTIALAVAVFMVGCKGNDLPVDDGKLKIVTTIFPEYDWVKQIAGDSNNLDITFLMKNGGDLHSYSPSAEDILKISSCDMLVYVGGESDKWIEEILENSVNSNIKTINLMNVLGEKAKEEELVEGMEDDDHDDHDDHDDDDAELEYDEHVWLSLDNAQLFIKSITENLCAIDSENAGTYKANCERYLSQLDALDDEYEEVIENSKYKTLIFADRFPFRYLTDDDDLSYYAAFKGCSAETEASFETITFLANKADELNLPRILTIDGSDGKIAKTVAATSKNKDRTIYSLDSLQSVTDNEVQSGKTYIKAMESNLEILKKALN
mgnify:CR=1 FL=1